MKKNRSCGECHACCIALQLDAFYKPPREPCPNLRQDKQRGCRIYSERPRECKYFVCMWRSGIGDISKRPDRCGILVHITVNEASRDAPGLEVIELRAGAMDAFHNASFLAALRKLGVMMIRYQYIDNRRKVYSDHPAWIADARVKNPGLPIGDDTVAIEAVGVDDVED